MEYNEKAPASPYRDLTPHAVEPSQALVTLDGLVTLVTLGGTVPFHPEMMHYLQEGRERRRARRVRKGTWCRKNKIYTNKSGNQRMLFVFEPASFPLINHAGGVSCFNSIR